MMIDRTLVPMDARLPANAELGASTRRRPTTMDERTLSAKADIVAEALRRLRSAGVDTSRPVLVGDRHHDVEGGAEHDVPVVFVRWGFSWPHEAAGAQAAVDTVDELRGLLLLEDADD